MDLINFTLEDTKAIVAKFQGKIAQYVFCSSVWEQGRAEILLIDSSARNKTPLDEYGKQKFASKLYL